MSLPKFCSDVFLIYTITNHILYSFSEVGEEGGGGEPGGGGHTGEILFFL
jgi:hypothetical protein